MFNHTISIIGAKGGVGKTTLSHMLSYGLARFGIATVLVTTDHNPGRVSLDDDTRPYQTVAGQTAQDLENIFNTFSSLGIDPATPRVMIVDGGGNRVELDKLLYLHSDLTLLPFRDSREDIRVVSADLNRYNNALGLPNGWPTNTFAQVQVTTVLEDMQNHYPGRILTPSPSIRSSQSLLRENPDLSDSRLNSVCKKLAVEVMSKININVFEIN